MMKRRSFLRGLVAVPAIPLIDKLPVAEATPVFKHKTVSAGFTADIAAFGRALWPGINKWYAEAYKDIPADYKKELT